MLRTRESQGIRALRDRAIIRPIKRAAEDELLDLPGVVAVDIGGKSTRGRPTGQLAITVSVQHKTPAKHLAAGQMIPTDILGIPTDVIEEQPTPHHENWSTQGAIPPRAARTRVGGTFGGSGISPRRPVLMEEPDGTMGQYRRIGTLGALVTGQNPGGVTMGLTTFDTACLDDAWSVGDPMTDPLTGAVYADLARAALSSRADAAAVVIGYATDRSALIPGIGAITGHSTPYPGEAVRKSGFGTGTTFGTVLSTDTTLRIDHGNALGFRVLRDQVRVRAGVAHARFAAAGDAGAVLVNPGGRIVGLHFAGSADGTIGFACPIADVLTELDVRLCVETQRLSV